MFNLTRTVWHGIIEDIRNEEIWWGTYFDIVRCLLSTVLITIPADIIVLPLDVIIYIAIKTDKNKKKRK